MSWLLHAYSYFRSILFSSRSSIRGYVVKDGLKIRLNLIACLKIVGIFYGNYYHIVGKIQSVRESKLRITKCIKLYYNGSGVSFHYHLYNMYYKGYTVKFFFFFFILFYVLFKLLRLSTESLYRFPPRFALW